MSSSGDVTLVVAIAASLIGTGVAGIMWRRQVRHERVGRRTHPSMQLPLTLAAVDAGTPGEATRQWRVDVRHDAAPISVDIVTSRASSSMQPWHSEPIVAPIRLEPGGWAVLSSEFAPEPAYDAVVGWTEHRADGDVQRSHTFHVLDAAADPVAAIGGSAVGQSRLRLDLFVTCLLVAALGLTIWAFTADDARDGVTGSPVLTSGNTPLVTTLLPPSTTSTPASGPSTTEPSPTESSSTPTTSRTTAPTTTPTSTIPTTTAPTTTVPEGPRVEIFGSIGECRFGSDCLIAGFRLVEFTTSPTEYVCEFADGGRITFRFGGDGVDTACATGSAAAAITIEVEGVRSATITRDSVAQESAAEG